jgi:hypothetical protein
MVRSSGVAGHRENLPMFGRGALPATSPVRERADDAVE